jgi:regulator of protease activity HflC (stomatin/prohibitin superfamily)
MSILQSVGAYFIWIVLALIVLIILAKNIIIVQQSKAYVIERLGAFHSVWGVGIHFKIPLLNGAEGRIPEGTGGGFSASAGHHER